MLTLNWLKLDVFDVFVFNHPKHAGSVHCMTIIGSISEMESFKGKNQFWRVVV